MLAPALIISVAVGTVLGQRYKVFVLAPVCGLVLGLATAMAVIHPEAIWRIAGATLVAMVFLQVGYVLGLALRHVALVVRATRVRSVSTRHPEPSRRVGPPTKFFTNRSCSIGQ